MGNVGEDHAAFALVRPLGVIRLFELPRHVVEGVLHLFKFDIDPSREARGTVAACDFPKAGRETVDRLHNFLLQQVCENPNKGQDST